MKKTAITFDEAIDILKKDIEYGRIKVTDEKIGRMMDIFITIPTLKLNKIEEVKAFKVKKPSMFKRGLIKVKLFSRIW